MPGTVGDTPVHLPNTLTVECSLLSGYDWNCTAEGLPATRGLVVTKETKVGLDVCRDVVALKYDEIGLSGRANPLGRMRCRGGRRRCRRRP
jgi:hypothetical protein